MHENTIANGTSSNVAGVTCTNNTSTSLMDGGISSTNNSDVRSISDSATSVLSSSTNTNSAISAPHIQNASLSVSSGENLPGTPINASVNTTRASDAASENLGSNNVDIADQSS